MHAAVPELQGASRLQDYDLLMYLFNLCLCCQTLAEGDNGMGLSTDQVMRSVTMSSMGVVVVVGVMVYSIAMGRITEGLRCRPLYPPR